MPLREDVREFLQSHGLRLNTDLGQHFLVDDDVLETILNTAEIEEGDHVVEIGPGIGVLTRELTAQAKQVTAIELDERMIPLLQQFVGLTPDLNRGLTVINANALQVPFPQEPYKVVANIPYHITSPLLRHAFFESERAPTSLTLLIQREVAEKICDEDDASLLTIIVRLFGEPSIACIVPPKAFLPPPKVDSAVLHIACFPEPLADRETMEEVMRLAKLGFSQKRKMLRNTLGAFTDLSERLSRLGIDEKRRPQTLSVDEWIALAKAR